MDFYLDYLKTNKQTEKHLILKGESDLSYKYFSFVNDVCSGCMRRQVNCMWCDLLHSSSHWNTFV